MFKSRNADQSKLPYPRGRKICSVNSALGLYRKSKVSDRLRVDRTEDAHTVRSSIDNVCNAAIVTQNL